MEDTAPKAFVFVLMPFSSEFADIYEVGIKQACKDAGAYCERVDEQFFDESILERIYNQIATADIIVAEMTGRNSNVFYETGYAHALNKRVILLTQQAEDIAFDLNHFPHIVYGGKISSLKIQLETKIRWCIEHPKESIAKDDLNLEIYSEGVSLIGKPEIIFKPFEASGMMMGNVKFAVHNKGARSLADGKDIKIYLIMEEEIARVFFTGQFSGRDLITMSNGRYMLRLFLKDGDILPDGWDSIDIRLQARPMHFDKFPLPLTLSTNSVFGTQDYPFTLNWQRKNNTTSGRSETR